MTIKGVGPKVADCVLLFGLGFTEAFPIDVWIKRVISKYYGDGFTPDYFGKYAGIAQQFLFYSERLK
jgi:N-glycosylase/DNA lyase